MSDYFCPSCDAPLTSEHINIAEGVAMCPNCGKLSRLSEVIEHERPRDEIVNDPPSGCTMRNDIDATVIRVSLRSASQALGMLFFCLFWNGILSVFLLIAISGLYTNLIGPLPDWAPAPTMEGEDGPMSLGMTLFLCIFLIPFVLVGLTVAGGVLMSLMGGTIIRVRSHGATVKTGVGPIGWTQRFDPRRFRNITIGKSKWKNNDEYKDLIEIEADKTIRFGSGMSGAKRDWLIAVLRSLLKDAT